MEAKPDGLGIDNVSLKPTNSPPSLDTTQYSSSSTSFRESRTPSPPLSTPRSSPASSSGETFEKPRDADVAAAAPSGNDRTAQRRVAFMAPQSPSGGETSVAEQQATLPVTDGTRRVQRYEARRDQGRIWLRRLQAVCRVMVGHAWSIIGLAVGAVGLLFFGWRQLRLTNIATDLEFVQTCLGWDEERDGKRNQACDDYIRRFHEGEFSVPYDMGKRSLDAARKAKSEILSHATRMWRRVRREDKKEEAKLSLSLNFVLLVTAVVFLVVAFVSVVVMKQMRWRARRQNQHQQEQQRRLRAAARATYLGNEWRVRKHQPTENEDLYKLGQYLRSSQSSSNSSSNTASVNTSSETLASAEIRRRSTPRRVSVHNAVNDEESAYDNLIELPSKQDTKIFFEPNTGAFIRLSPWKSQNDDEDSDDERVQRGDTQQAIARMGSGAVALAAGKRLDEMIREEIQYFEDSKQHFRVGDSMQGMMLHDQALGKSHSS